MTRTEIIKAAHQHTENKLAGVIDDQIEYVHALQEFCAEHRFWWKKKNLTFSTAASTPTYDLASITTTPAGAGAYVEEITKVIRLDGTNVVPMEPITDDEAVATMMASTTADKPGTWTIDSSDVSKNQVIRMNIPNGVYTIQAFFWAMPNPSTDSSDDTVYIVPQALHHVIVTALEKNFCRIAFGVQDPKYTSAVQLYGKKVQQATMKPSFWSGKTQYFKDQSQTAVRSTR